MVFSVVVTAWTRDCCGEIAWQMALERAAANRCEDGCRCRVACTGGCVWRRSLVSRGDVRFHSTFANVGHLCGAHVAQQVRNRIWS